MYFFEPPILTVCSFATQIATRMNHPKMIQFCGILDVLCIMYCFSCILYLLKLPLHTLLTLQNGYRQKNGQELTITAQM